MKVLHVAPSFYPATFWGGPIWSTKAICDGIASRAGFSVKVLTTDAAGPATHQRVTPVALPYKVTFHRRLSGHSFAPAMLAALPNAIASADVVHLTGVYNAPTLPTFVLCKLIGKPLIWSPRGALQATREWHDTPKRRAKLLFERALCRAAPANLVMHVTAQREAEMGRLSFPTVAISTIPNAVAIPQVEQGRPRDGQKLRLMYMGRLHPKKGLNVLFDALQQLPPDFTLDVYGSGHATDEAHLLADAERLAGRVRFMGLLADDQKANAFARADLFVLPSHSENFGIVVAEALAHAVPVLTTQATPWQGLDAKECGRCVALSADNLAEAITGLRCVDLRAAGARGRAWMCETFAMPAMVDSFAKLYRDAAQPILDEVHV